MSTTRLFIACRLKTKVQFILTISLLYPILTHSSIEKKVTSDDNLFFKFFFVNSVYISE